MGTVDSGVSTNIAKLTAKVASVDALAFERAGDAAGYGTTQQIVLDDLSVAMQTNNFAAYDYWNNVCSSIYQNLSQSDKAKWDNSGFSQGPMSSSNMPLFGNTGIAGYWSEQAANVGTWIKTAVVGDQPGAPEAGTSNTMLIISLVVLIVIFWLLFR